MFDVASMSCSHVLAGHTEIVMCLDTCVSSSGRTLVVTGSKDNSVSFSIFVSHMAVAGSFSLFECLVPLDIQSPLS